MLAGRTQAAGEGSRGLMAAVEAWRGEDALATFVAAGPQVRASGAVRSAVLERGEAQDAMDGPVLRVQVGSACFSLPLQEVEAWAAEAQSINGGPECSVLTVEAAAWSLVL